jgi:hypothetical protein
VPAPMLLIRSAVVFDFLFIGYKKQIQVGAIQARPHANCPANGAV